MKEQVYRAIAPIGRDDKLPPIAVDRCVRVRNVSVWSR